ncbi:hypothetical protein PDIDSM_7636 [Penicillium digitatum]|nr:hypothetical protein PDIDSM_7636 [Penicillium digitatum]
MKNLSKPIILPLFIFHADNRRGDLHAPSTSSLAPQVGNQAVRKTQEEQEETGSFQSEMCHSSLKIPQACPTNKQQADETTDTDALSRSPSKVTSNSMDVDASAAGLGDDMW